MLGAALALGSPLALAPWPTAAFVASVALWLLRQQRAVLVVAALVALGLGNARARHALRAYETERAALVGDFQSPRPCHGVGVIERSPSGHVDGSFSLEVRASELHCDGAAERTSVVQLSVPVEVFDGAMPWRRGDRVAFEAELAVVTRFVLVELPDPRPRAASRGVQLSGRATFVEVMAAAHGPAAWIDAAREHVRAQVRGYFSASRRRSPRRCCSAIMRSMRATRRLSRRAGCRTCSRCRACTWSWQSPRSKK